MSTVQGNLGLDKIFDIGKSLRFVKLVPTVNSAIGKKYRYLLKSGMESLT